MARHMRQLDGSRTPLGAPEAWPQTLKTVVRLMLSSRYAMWLAWGPELTFLCNDACRPTLGDKRDFLGAPASQVWAEIWPDIGPRIHGVFTTGEATRDEGLQLFLQRRGFVEETRHTFSYSPVHGDDGAVEGVLCIIVADDDAKRRGPPHRLLSHEAGTALRESEELLRAALAAAGAGTWALDLHTEQAEWSAETYDMLGIDPGVQPATATGMERVHPQDARDLLARRDEQLARDGRLDLEFRVQHPTRGIRWLHLLGSRVSPQRVVGIVQDVTERKRAEERLLLITDSVPGLVSYIDADLRYRFNNRAYEEWFGRPREAVLGRRVNEVLGEAAFQVLRPHMEAALAGRPAHFDVESPYADGGTRHIHASYVPDRLVDGSVAGFYVFVTDITQRKRDEAELAKARNELAAQVRDLTLLHEMTSRLTPDRELQPMLEDLARAAVALTNAPQILISLVDPEQGDLVPMTTSGFSKEYLRHVERIPKGRAASGACFERREPVIVEDTETDPLFEPWRDIARLGGYRSVHAKPLLARDGSVLGVLTLFKPQPGTPTLRARRFAALLVRHAAGVLEHMQLQKALQASERRFRTMADTAPAMLWVTDTQNRLTFISRGWSSYTGQPVEAAHREGVGWRDMAHADDRDRTGQRFAEAAGRREAFELEYRLHRSDGTYRWVLDAGQPRFADDGTWLGYIGSVIDIHETLVAREALREADRRKDEFLATLAHELRNPLAPIRNALHLLNLAGSGAQAKGLHEMIQRQVDHMVRLVDDLMEASRISRGKLELQREPMPLGEAIRTAVEASRPLIDHARHRLELDLGEEPLSVNGDAVRLAQVFSNLLNNAAKYTEDGGHIQLVARREGSYARVEVRDNGIGIAAENLPRVFDMFSQLDRNAARTGGGMGIGLALAQRLAQMHGGSLTAHSEGLGHGSRFVVRLPLAAAASAEDTPGSAPVALDQRRILVVDDNEDAADSLGMLLRFLGAEVHVEHDGAAALEAARQWRPAVVLLDLGMPKMDGFEVARRLRADPVTSRVKLIALTGWGQERDRQRTRDAGFDHHLIKPVDINFVQMLLASLGEPVTPGGS